MKIKNSLLALIVMVTISNHLIAQPSTRTTAWNYFKEGQIAKAKEAIDAASVNELTAIDPKTWHFKALIYRTLSATNDSILKGLCKDALTETFEAVKKSNQFDAKKTFKSDNNLILKDLCLLLFNDGVEGYNGGVQSISSNPDLAKKSFNKALYRFDQFMQSLKMMEKDSMSVILELAKFKIDHRDVYYYAANSANQTGDKAKAVSLFEGLVNSKYSGYATYGTLADLYMEKKDTAAALKVIEKGKLYNTDKEELKNLTLKELQIYQMAGKLNELTAKLQKALNDDPNNPNLLITLGESYYTISEKLSEEKKYTEAESYRNQAIEIYLKSLALLPDTETELRFLLNNKIGTIYYNVGVDYYNQSVLKENENREKELKELYMKYFDMAIPYLEKSMEINPADKASIPLLKKIYLLKGNMEKFTELSKKEKE